MKTAILFSRVRDNIFQYFCRVKNLVKIYRAILSIWSGRSILLIWPGNFLIHFHDISKYFGNIKSYYEPLKNGSIWLLFNIQELKFCLRWDSNPYPVTLLNNENGNGNGCCLGDRKDGFYFDIFAYLSSQCTALRITVNHHQPLGQAIILIQVLHCTF